MVAAHTLNPSNGDTEVGGSLPDLQSEFQGSKGCYRETLSQNKQTKDGFCQGGNGGDEIAIHLGPLLNGRG